MAIIITELMAMASLSVILYILISILPRINDAEVQEITSKVSLENLLGRLEKADEFVLSFFEKFLRRVRVVLLKLDNVVTKKLSEFKKENGAKEAQAPFSRAEEAKK